MPGPPPEIQHKVDRFIDECRSVVKRWPALVVILMHEFSRNLYPSDPYIPFRTDKHRLDAVSELLDALSTIIRDWSVVGSYDVVGRAGSGESKDDIRDKTGVVYGKLWTQYPDTIVEEARDMLVQRLTNNDIPLSLVEGATVLDAGCGSGRYSCALAMLGARKVIGLDCGDSGLAKARALAEAKGLDSVEFCKGDVLHMPFEDESFDFVFSNGVAHHTGDIAGATREIFRVMAVGGHGWYYIYGDGGVFWYAWREMNAFMKKAIPQDYALAVLRLIGMPGNRHIFADNWYVPIEEHTSKTACEELLKRTGFREFRRCYKGRPTDLDYFAVCGSEKDRLMWGDGELRYLISK